jgi:hypothetical protein
MPTRVSLRRVGIAQRKVARGSFGQRRREHADLHVVVVVDLGAALSGEGSEHPADVLDEAALESDGRGKEEGVQRWTVESFADERAGGDDEQGGRRAFRVESRESLFALSCSHAAAQNDGLETVVLDFGCDPFQVGRPLSQDQTMPSARICVENVLGDLMQALIVRDQVAVDRSHASWLVGKPRER